MWLLKSLIHALGGQFNFAVAVRHHSKQRQNNLNKHFQHVVAKLHRNTARSFPTTCCRCIFRLFVVFSVSLTPLTHFTTHLNLLELPAPIMNDNEYTTRLTPSHPAPRRCPSWAHRVAGRHGSSHCSLQTREGKQKLSDCYY